MRQLRRRFVRPLTDFVLPLFTLAVMSVAGFGQEESPKAPEQKSSPLKSKVTPDDRITLEASRRGFEAQYKYSEEYAKKIADEYREAVEQKSPDPNELAKLKRSLEVAVRNSLKNQLLLQQTRISLAELDLIELQAKQTRRESLADKIIMRRIADLLSGEDRGWSKQGEPTEQNHEPDNDANSENPEPGEDDIAQTETIPDFSTPRELLDYLFQSSKADEDTGRQIRVALSLMTEDEQNRFAGVCLRTASMVRSAAKVAAGFSLLSPDGQNAEVVRMGIELEALITESRLEKAPRRAQVAFDQICAGEINLLQVLLSSQTANSPQRTIEPQEYSARLRRAAGVLKDPVQFCVDFIILMADFSEETKKKETENDRTEPDWDNIEIREEGDRAYVINHLESRSLGESSFGTNPFVTNQMELVREGNTWKIASTLDDKHLIELQQGIQLSKGSNTQGRSTDETAEKPESSPEEDGESEDGEHDQAEHEEKHDQAEDDQAEVETDDN